MAGGTTHPPWLRPPVARWRIHASDAAFFLVLITAVGGTSAWCLRWIPPVMTWLEPVRALTRPGYAAALLLSGHAPDETVILMTWPVTAPCILANALLLWGPMLALRAPTAPPRPVALWVAIALLATIALNLLTPWSPSG